MKKLLLFLSFTACSLIVAGQSGQLIFPDTYGWTIINENEEISFQLKTTRTDVVKFAIDGQPAGVQFDSTGHFYWKPSFDLVDRIARFAEVPIIFQVTFADGARERKTVVFTVKHVNRPPAIEDLPVVYVKQANQNTFQIPTEYVYDADGDPIVYKAISAQMPEGATLTSQGQFNWTPSRSQFASLKANPLTIDFIVQDQPNKAETRGKLRLAQTQLDLPPEILIVPADTLIVVKEDETVNLKVYVSDPNGDDNVRSAGIIPSDQRIPSSTLKENTLVQYEFTWMPGYNFVEEVKKSADVIITFFVLDKTNNRTQRRIRIRVLDTENVVEKDALQYMKYRNSLVSAMLLISQLDDNQKKLNAEYKRARKGKKRRSVLNASLGAATGISPLTLDADDARIISSVGGTTVLTLGTLEATEVIGRSKEGIMEKIRNGIDIRNRIQSQGDEFARKYSLKSARRNPDFEKDIDKLRAAMNDQKLVLLELDAYTGSRAKIDNKDIKKVFIDFTEE